MASLSCLEKALTPAPGHCLLQWLAAERPRAAIRLQRNLTHGQLQPSHHFLPIACGWNHSEPWCPWPNPSEVKLQCREAGLYSGWGGVDPSLPHWCRLMPCAPNLRVQWSGSLSLYFSFLLICHYRCNPWMHSPVKHSNITNKSKALPDYGPTLKGLPLHTCIAFWISLIFFRYVISHA